MRKFFIPTNRLFRDPSSAEPKAREVQSDSRFGSETESTCWSTNFSNSVLAMLT